MDFAVIETGGKQYKVAPGDTIKIEKLPEEYEAGKKITFDKVLLARGKGKTSVGTPYVAGAKVEGTLAEEGRGRKVSVIRFRPKSRYFKKKGHRQPYTKVAISSIV